MQDKTDQIKNQYPHEIALRSQQFGFLDERAYRNFCIKEEYDILKNDGMKKEDAVILLSDKWSSKHAKLSPETISQIIYR